MLDPLLFKAEITGNIDSELKAIEDKLKKIPDKEIKVSIQGTAELREFIQLLSGKNALKSRDTINKEIETLERNLQGLRGELAGLKTEYNNVRKAASNKSAETQKASDESINAIKREQAELTRLGKLQESQQKKLASLQNNQKIVASDDAEIKRLQEKLELTKKVLAVSDQYREKFKHMTDKDFDAGFKKMGFRTDDGYKKAFERMKEAYNMRMASSEKSEVNEKALSREHVYRQMFKSMREGWLTKDKIEDELKKAKTAYDDLQAGGAKERTNADMQAYREYIKVLENYLTVIEKVNQEQDKLGIERPSRLATSMGEDYDMQRRQLEQSIAKREAEISKSNTSRDEDIKKQASLVENTQAQIEASQKRINELKAASGMTSQQEQEIAKNEELANSFNALLTKYQELTAAKEKAAEGSDEAARLDAEIQKISPELKAMAQEQLKIQEAKEAEKGSGAGKKAIQESEEELAAKQKIADKQNEINALQEKLNMTISQVAKEESAGSFENVLKTIKEANDALKEDNFGKFATNINEAVKGLDALNEAFTKFKTNIGDESASNFVKNISTMAQNVKSQEAQKQASSSGQTGTQMYNNIELAKNKERELIKLAEDAQDVFSRFGNNSALEVQIAKVRELVALLQEFKKNGKATVDGQELTTSQFVRSFDFKSNVDDLKEMKKEQEAINKQSFKNLELEERREEMAKAQTHRNQELALTASIKQQETDNKNINDAAVAYERFGVALKNAEEARDKGDRSQQDIQHVNEYIAHLQKVRDLLLEIQKTGFVPQSQMQKELGLTPGMSTAQALQQIGVQKDMIWGRSNMGDLTKDLTDAKANMKQAEREANKLTRSISDLSAKSRDANAIGIDTAHLDQVIDRLRTYRTELQDIARNNTKSTDSVILQEGFLETQREKKKALKEVNDATKEKEKSNQKTSRSEKDLAKNIRHTTKEAEKQSRVFGQLKNMTAQFLSIAFVKRFVTEMMNITGELELQKRSLEVIIDNATKASQLYADIRELSQESPYTFQDLLKSERQLAAFGIQTKDLYPTMKALSDIGAGLSVDVQRLILAYGHTRSYGYLSGIQNRQFETAGIDLIGELAKFYNKQAAKDREEGRAAKNTSRMELFTRMRKRDISFEDVEKVILALDQPGGKFFNMQERQFDTLGGKLRNLRNNYNIMMSEMGQSSMGFLMGIVNMLNKVTDEWQKYANVIKTVLIPLGSMKVLMMAVNAAGWANIRMTKALHAQRRGWKSLGTTLEGFGMNFSHFFKRLGAFLVGPQSIIFAAIAGLTVLINHMRKANQQIKELQNNLSHNGGNDKNSINDIINTYATGYTNRSIANESNKDGVHIIRYKFEMDDEALMKSNLSGAIADMKEKLQAMSPLYDRDLVNIDKMKTQYDQFKALVEKMESLRYASNLKEAYANAFGLATKESAGGFGTRWFKDNFVDDIQDYQKTLRKSFDYIESLTEEAVANFDKTLGGELTHIKEVMKHSDLKESFKYYLNTIARAYDDAAIASGGKKLAYEYSNKVLPTNANNWQAWASPEIANSLPAQNTANDFYSVVDRFMRPEAFGRTLSSQYKELLRGVEPIARQISDAVRASYKTGEEDLAADFVAMMIEEFKTTTGITMPEVISTMYDIILGEMKDQMDGTDFKKYMDENKLLGLFNDAVRGKISTRTTRQQAFGYYKVDENGKPILDENGKPVREPGIIDQVVKDITGPASMMGLDIQAAGGATGTLFMNAMEKAMADYKLNFDWQERLIGPEGIIQINTSLASQLKGISDATEAAEAMQKEYDELMKTLETTEGIAGGALEYAFGALGMEFKPKKLTDDIKRDNKQLEKAIQERVDMMGKIIAAAQELATNEKKSGNEATQQHGWRLQGIIDSELTPALTQNQSILEILRASKKMNWPINLDKGGYQADIEKRWDERIRIMKEAYDWYDKWEKKVGEAEAIKKVNDRYGQIFEAWAKDEKLPFKFAAENVKDYIKYVEQIRDDAYKEYQEQQNNPATGYGQEAERVWRQAVAVLEDFNWDTFAKAAQDFSSIIEKTLDDMDRRWEIYDKVFAITGSREASATIANMASDEADYIRQAAAVRGDLESKLSDYNVEVEFDTGMDQESILKMFQKAIPTGDENAAKTFKEKIDGFTKEYQRWQKLELDAYKKTVDTYVSLAQGLVDTQSVIERAAAEFEQTGRDLAPLQDVNPELYNRMMQVAQLKLDEQTLQASTSYTLLMDGVITMNHEAAEQLRDDYAGLLMRQLKAGTITAKQYADGIEDINDKMRELQNAPSYLRSFIESGINGLLENMKRRGQGMVEQGAKSIQDAQKMYQEADEMMSLVEGTDDVVGKQKAAELNEMAHDAEEAGTLMANAGQGMSSAASSGLQTVAIIDMIIHGIDNLVQNLAGTYNRIKDLQVALGDRDEEEWTNADTFWSSFSSASSSATKGWDSLKNGDIGGVIDGVVGSWTEWFKGYAEGRDKKLDYQVLLAERQLSILSDIDSRVDKIKQDAFGYNAKADQGDIENLQKSLYEYEMQGKSMSEAEAAAKWGGNVFKFIGNLLTGHGKEMRNGTYADSPYREDTVAAMKLAVQTGSVYDVQFANLLRRRDLLESELKDLEAQSNKDESKIQQAKNDLWEVKRELANFAADIARELYSIDVKGWADQISDAIVNAFQNGENAAEAFEDATRSIMQSVTSNIIKVGVVQPMMEKLQQYLFGWQEGDTWHEGITSQAKMSANPMEEGLKLGQAIAQWMKTEGEGITLAAQEIWTAANAGMNGLLTNKNGKTLSASIQGTSEETSTLIAGYINAARQDLSAQRILMEDFVERYSKIFTEEKINGMIADVNLIRTDVRRIAESVAPEGLETMHSMMSTMQEILTGIRNGTVSVTMN